MSVTPSTNHTFEIKQGDTAPVLETVLIDNYGNPVDLTSLVSLGIRLVMVGAPFLHVFGDGDYDLGVAEFEADETGVVRYRWQAGDTDVSGTYKLEWVGVWPASQIMTFPSRGYDKVQINSIG